MNKKAVYGISQFMIYFLLFTGKVSSEPDNNVTDLNIIDWPIKFTQERIDLTIAYRQFHQDPKINDIFIQPLMVILHFTCTRTVQAAWKYFNLTYSQNKNMVNVSCHFLVDRDGTIYRLMPENWMARHCIGLNHISIGIENVGDDKDFPLTEAQVNANACLVRYLSNNYPITHLIGHSEYRLMEGHPYFLERDPKYRNRKPDPGPNFMKKVRALVSDLNLKSR